MGWGNKASNGVGDLENRSIEFFGLSVLVHSAQAIRHNVCLPQNVLDDKIGFLKSVKSHDLAGGRFCHGLEVLQRRSVSVDYNRESVQVVPPLGGRFHEGQNFLLVYRIVDLVLV